MSLLIPHALAQAITAPPFSHVTLNPQRRFEHQVVCQAAKYLAQLGAQLPPVENLLHTKP